MDGVIFFQIQTLILNINEALICKFVNELESYERMSGEKESKAFSSHIFRTILLLTAKNSWASQSVSAVTIFFTFLT